MRTPRWTLAPLLVAASMAVTPILPYTVRADTAQKDFRWEGEELYYSVEISGAEAARASLRAGKRKKARGTAYVPVSGTAMSHGFFAKSYPINDAADTFIDAASLMPLKADKDIREDGNDRNYKVRYDPAKFEATIERTSAGHTRKYTRPIPERTYDALSWMYDVRTLPLKDGDKYTYFVFDGWKLSKLYLTVVGREKTWTPLGYYDTVKVDVDREIMNARWISPRKKAEGTRLSVRTKRAYFSTFHLTDDPQRLPVRIFVTSKLGDSDFKLIKYVPPAGTSAKAPAEKRGAPKPTP